MRQPSEIFHNGVALDEILRLHCMWLRGKVGGARAILDRAIMTDAIMTDADLTGAIGNMGEVRSMQIDTWPVTYTSETLQIGCQRHSIAKWRKWDTDAGRKWITTMDSAAPKWADRNLALVLQIIDTNPATRHAGHTDEPAATEDGE
jgi:hypothetical protein